MKTRLLTLLTLALASTFCAKAQSDFLSQFAGNADYTISTMNKQQIEESDDEIKVGELSISGYFMNLIDSVAYIGSTSPEANARLLEAARREFSEANGYEFMASGNENEDGESADASIVRKSLGDKGFCTVIIGENPSADPAEAGVSIIIGPFDIANPFKDLIANPMDHLNKPGVNVEISTEE